MGTELFNDAEFGEATSIGEAVFKVLVAACFMYVLPVFASPGPLKTQLSRNDLLERIRFQYMTSDGSLMLACQHYANLNSETDYDVYCGKGSGQFKEYVAHLIVRQSTKPSETTYEILYWLTDRNQGKSSAYSSTSQLITVDGKAPLKRFSLSQSLENDMAQLYVTFKD
jgi:hypothetical protein